MIFATTPVVITFAAFQASDVARNLDVECLEPILGTHDCAKTGCLKGMTLMQVDVPHYGRQYYCTPAKGFPVVAWVGVAGVAALVLVLVLRK